MMREGHEYHRRRVFGATVSGRLSLSLSAYSRQEILKCFKMLELGLNLHPHCNTAYLS